MNKERHIITFDDPDDGGPFDDKKFKLIEETIVDQRRWTTQKTIIVQEKATGKFFRSDYSFGSTESQDQSPYEYDDKILTEVFPIEKMVVVYE